MDGVTPRPIHTDFENGFVTDAYSRLDTKHSISPFDFERGYMDAYSRLGTRHSISPFDFERGYTVFRMKNTPGDEYKPIGVHRHSHLELQFAKPLKSSFVVFILCSIPKSLTISNARAVEVIEE